MRPTMRVERNNSQLLVPLLLLVERQMCAAKAISLSPMTCSNRPKALKSALSTGLPKKECLTPHVKARHPSCNQSAPSSCFIMLGEEND